MTQGSHTKIRAAVRQSSRVRRKQLILHTKSVINSAAARIPADRRGSASTPAATSADVAAGVGIVLVPEGLAEDEEPLETVDAIEVSVRGGIRLRPGERPAEEGVVARPRGEDL